MSFYPGAAEFNSGTLTVDAALTDPTHIEQRIADLVQPNLLADHMFTTGGEVTGGAVIYSRTTEKHLFTENDVADRNPGDEYPVVYAERPESEIARVQDFGGKFAVTDEARRRNDAITFDNDVTRLSNTIKRKLDRRVIETLDAADATGETNQLAVPKKWSEVEVHGDPANRSAGVDLPASVLATAIGLGEEKDLGISYNRLLVTPMTRAHLRALYGPDLKAMLDDFGLEMFASVHVPEGKAYLVDKGNVGFLRYEETLTVETYDDREHRKTWVQGYAMPVMGVTLPAAIATISGI